MTLADLLKAHGISANDLLAAQVGAMSAAGILVQAEIVPGDISGTTTIRLGASLPAKSGVVR